MNHVIYMPGSIPIPATDFTGRAINRISWPTNTAVDVTVFPDGETAIRIPTNIGPHSEVILVGECSTPLASEVFLAAAYEIASKGPQSLRIVNTYFRHARSERESDYGHAALAKFQARQWSGIGRIFPGVQLEFVELHKDLIRHYFEGPVITKNWEFRGLLQRTMRNNLSLKNPVYATVDEGGVDAARALARDEKVGFAFIVKKRLSGTETEIRDVLGDNVKGRDVAIFDDIISTGTSMVHAIEAFKARGANFIVAAATHGVFVNDAVERMIAAGVNQIMVTDSHPNANKVAALHPKVVQVVPLDF